MELPPAPPLAEPEPEPVLSEPAAGTEPPLAFTVSEEPAAPAEGVESTSEPSLHISEPEEESAPEEVADVSGFFGDDEEDSGDKDDDAPAVTGQDDNEP